MRTHAVVPAVMAAAIGRVAAQEEGTTGELGDAQVVEGNPTGLVYEATLPEEAWSDVSVEGNVKGSIIAQSAEDGVGVEFTVSFSNLPLEEGHDFNYHVHVAPVPEDGNCTETLAHLDPYIRGADEPCDSDAPETCEVGDLSGKHGKIVASDSDGTYEHSYIDKYSSLIEGEGAFLGNRSFVLHFADDDGTRVTCASFELKSEGGDGEGEGDCSSAALPAPTGGEDEYPEYPGGEDEELPVPPPVESEAVPPPTESEAVPPPEDGEGDEGDEVPVPSATESLEPEPTAGAGMTAASFSLMGAAAIAAGLMAL